jgi:hypothetical protein
MADDHIQPEPERRRQVRRDLPAEEVPRRRLRREDEDEDLERRFRRSGDATGGLIPYRNPQALIAYYLGVFSLIPCLGAVLGPGALVLGILGLSYRKKDETVGGMAHAIVGIVLGSLTTLAHLGVGLAVALMYLLK